MYLAFGPTSELKPLVVDTSGYSTQQLVSEPYSSDDGNKDIKPVNINEKQKVGSSNGTTNDNEEGTTNGESKKASSINQNEDLTDTKKKVLVSSISIPFEALQKGLAAIFRRNNGKVGNIFFKISVDLGKLVGQIEFCGITQEKDVTMISTGKGILREATA